MANNVERTETEILRRQRVVLERRRLVLGALAALGGGASSWGKLATANFWGNETTQLDDLEEVKTNDAPIDWFREDWCFDADSFALPKSALEAIDASLAALAARQNPDGSFGYASELFGRDPGVAALCGLAFLAAGSAPGRGPLGDALERIVGYVLSRSFDAKKSANGALDLLVLNYLEENNLTEVGLDGLIVNFDEKGRKPMYGHGFATLFLAAILGENERPELRERTQAAVDLIVRAQNADGGWRYEPKRVPVADLSVTACQLSALRAARDAGILVPNVTVEKAVGYVERCRNEDGGFRYMTLDGPSGIARTAAAILALQTAGADDTEAVEAGFRYLEKAAPLASNGGVRRWKERSSTQGKEEANVAEDEIPRLPTTQIEYYFYGEFYAALAYWRGARDAATKERWARWARRAYPNLLSRRGDDGLWRSNVSTDAETALVLCALLTPFERAPFFLR
jgi:hypothetical protein